MDAIFTRTNVDSQLAALAGNRTPEGDFFRKYVRDLIALPGVENVSLTGKENLISINTASADLASLYRRAFEDTVNGVKLTSRPVPHAPQEPTGWGDSPAEPLRLLNALPGVWGYDFNATTVIFRTLDKSVSAHLDPLVRDQFIGRGVTIDVKFSAWIPKFPAS
jgi:hypothetical protein